MGMAPRGVVAVAASAGGVEALRAFVRALPGELEAAVLVVLHIPPTGPSVLPDILSRAGKLTARHPVDGELLEAGVVLVAPPDRHLAVEDGRVRLDAGPRQDGHRPSANVLLSSVARAYGTHAAGVVLSGTMDDGAAGLRAVREAGGLAAVQDPAGAAFAGMPQAAIEAAHPQVVATIGALAERVVSFMGELAEQGRGAGRRAGRPGPGPGEALAAPDELSPYTCPECGGTLWMERSDGAPRFRCRVGHEFSSEGLWIGKKDATEAALWAAVVALQERADLAERVAERLGRVGGRHVGRYQEDAAASRGWADQLRSLLPELLETPVTGGMTEGDDDDAGA